MVGRELKFTTQNIFVILISIIMAVNNISSDEIIGKDSAEISEKVKMYSDEMGNSDYYIKSVHSNVSDINVTFTLNQSIDDDIFSFNLTMDPVEQYGGVSLPGYSGIYDSNAVLNLFSNFTGEVSQINSYSMLIELDQKYRNTTSSIWYVSSDGNWIELDSELSQITDGQILIEFDSGPIFPTGQIVLMGFELAMMQTPDAFPINPSLIWDNQTSGGISLLVNWNYEGTYLMDIDHINIELQKYPKRTQGEGYSDVYSSVILLESGEVYVTTFEISSFDTDDAQYVVIISVCNDTGCNPYTASLTFILENQTTNITQDENSDNSNSINDDMSPAIELECSPENITVDTSPGASMTGYVTCKFTNPTNWLELIEVHVVGNGLVVAAPGTITLGPNSNSNAQIVVRADQRSEGNKIVTVTAYVTEINGNSTIGVNQSLSFNCALFYGDANSTNITAEEDKEDSNEQSSDDESNIFANVNFKVAGNSITTAIYVLAGAIGLLAVALFIGIKGKKGNSIEQSQTSLEDSIWDGKII